MNTDVVIIGAGPAGIFTALEVSPVPALSLTASFP